MHLELFKTQLDVDSRRNSEQIPSLIVKPEDGLKFQNLMHLGAKKHCLYKFNNSVKIKNWCIIIQT